MTTDTRAREVVEGMLARDRFSAWLGMELVSVEAGACTCRMTVREEMVNGFGVSHGGIVFSLADSAFAFACNSSGFITVSIENSIRYPSAIHPGDVLTAVVRQMGESKRLGYFAGEVTNQNGNIVGLFTGTSYRTDKPHAL
ncbi:MAG TPA: hotdog fold thioesterase [Gemmatimonadales bacterium]|nr:hotdog fold thioesterase [Gemmatimonadales bacterium]